MQQKPEYDFSFKIVLIGESGVGKSQILLRYTQNKFTHDTKSTIGVEFATKKLEIDDYTIKAVIWDTAGQDKFRAITNAFYRGSHGAFLVYDITNRNSFQNLGTWLDEFKKYNTDTVKVTLVGNKTDLRHLRAVTTEEGREYAAKHGLLFIETSALESINIDTAFSELVRDIYHLYKNHLDQLERKRSATTKNLTQADENAEGSAKKWNCCSV